MQITAEHQVRIGRELREERERRAMTIEEVARYTRVSVRHLQSLEADLFDELPGGVLRKGIVRSYCQYVGLDDEVWLERIAANGGLDETEPDLEQFADNVHRARIDSSPVVRSRWWGVLLLVAAVLALGYGVWHYVVRPRVGIGHGEALPQASFSAGEVPLGEARAGAGGNVVAAKTLMGGAAGSGPGGHPGSMQKS